MTTAPGVAVVATQLAQTDRRALSQAWYSALHLADGAPRSAAHRLAPRPVAASSAPEVAYAIVPAGTSARCAPSGPAPARAAHERITPAAERRRAPSEIARRVERAVERIAHAPRPRTAQTVTIDGGRVTLIVRTDAHATRVVALCSAPLRAHVERALAHARYALAARGTTVHAS
jgi:hypothetical protein